jgi:hypothetical protein
LYDLVGQVSDEGSFDLIVSTSGNYHMALSEFWFDHFLPEHPEINSWFYTTSPPVSLPQTARARVTFGNLRLHSRPHVAVGPMSVMDALDEAGVAVSTPVPILKNRGNVLLVRKGNPHGIESIWDLATDGVSVVTSNPATEPGSFGNYTNSIYQIARQDADYAGPLSAEDLFNAIFNANHPGKWLAGTRIHHREVPWSLIHGRGDVAPVFITWPGISLTCFRISSKSFRSGRRWKPPNRSREIGWIPSTPFRLQGIGLRSRSNTRRRSSKP